MKVTLVLLAVCAAVAVAAPQFAQLPVTLYRTDPAVSNSEVRDDAGQTSLSFSTVDGTSVVKQLYLKQKADGTDYVPNEKGEFAYIAPSGEFIRLAYVADENGFQPKGDHLPVAPVALA